MTIEERAKEYAPDPFDPDYILPAREEYIVKKQRYAYIAGATEQKAIDIDKACIILCRHVCPYDSNQCNAKCETWEIFRKAMEE